MIAQGLVDHRVRKGILVVRAKELPRRGVGECDVEERFVALAFDELGRGALGPDRLPDSSDRPVDAQMLVDEVLPGRDDPRRVLADLSHVREVDGLSFAVQRLAQ